MSSAKSYGLQTPCMIGKDACFIAESSRVLNPKAAGDFGDTSTMDSLHACAAESMYTGGMSSSMDASELSSLVAKNMASLPSVHDILLQQVVDAIQGDHVDLVARILSRMDAVRKTLEQTEHTYLVSFIRDIPNEVLAVFRCNVASVVQCIMAEVQSRTEVTFGAVCDRQGILAGKNARALASMGVAALPSAITGKFDKCIRDAHVAMSRHVDLIANGLMGTEISQWDTTDVAMEVMKDAQHILSAKVAAVTRECFEDVDRIVEDTLYLWKRSQSLSRANTVQVHQIALIGSHEPDVGKQVGDLDESRTIPQEAFADIVLRSQDFVSTQQDLELCSSVPRVSPSIMIPEGAELFATSAVASPGTSASNHPPDMSTGAFDEGCVSGSVGHPEICARPCVRAAAGECELGFSCGFCHMAHEKSGIHLDKKRRIAFKSMTYEERVSTILPLVRLKVVELQFDQELLQDISDIKETLQLGNYDSDLARSMRKIQRAHATKFTLRSLFSMMKNDTTQGAPSELQASVDRLFWKVKADFARRF